MCNLPAQTNAELHSLYQQALSAFLSSYPETKESYYSAIDSFFRAFAIIVIIDDYADVSDSQIIEEYTTAILLLKCSSYPPKPEKE